MKKLIPLFILCFFYLTPVNANQVSGGAALVISGSEASSRTLTISGKNFQKRMHLSSWEAARFEPLDHNGHNLPDGLYQFRLVRAGVHQSSQLTLGEAVKNSLNNKASNKRALIKSGLFKVTNGYIEVGSQSRNKVRSGEGQ